MANIITKSDFNTDIKIANKSDVVVNEDLTNFITKYEPRFLNMLFGSDFAALFIAELMPPVTDPVTPPSARMVALLTPDVRIAIASYIYYYYQRDQYAQTVGIGVVKTNPANAMLWSARDKVARAWEEMKVISWHVQKFLKDDGESDVPVYPEWVVPYWYKVFSEQWALFSYGLDVFDTEFYYTFGRFYTIPDIYYPLSRL